MSGKVAQICYSDSGCGPQCIPQGEVPQCTNDFSGTRVTSVTMNWYPASQKGISSMNFATGKGWQCVGPDQIPGVGWYFAGSTC